MGRASRRTKPSAILADRDRLEAELELERKLRRWDKEDAAHTIHYERGLRIAAQEGLVPYVAALEEFAGWLKTMPDVTPEMVVDKLTELGIWDVRVGYDPGQDLSLSAVSPQRR